MSEEAFQRSRRFEAVGRMADGFAHDFNNLLVVITGLADLVLERTAEDSPVRSDLLEIRAAAVRAGELTRKLLAFAREQAVEQQAVGVNDRLEEVAQMLDRLLGERTELRLELGEGVGHVFVDPNQLEQALVDLILSARDAAPEAASVVRLATATTAGFVALRVIGAELAAAPTPGGAAALAFVRHFAERAGGDLEVRGDPGGGSCIELRLPRYEG